MKTGFVALVGAGPGDPGLFTIRGRELLETADVVVYDRLVSEEIRRLMPKKARKIDVGKESSNHLVKQERINEILLEEALQGNRVIRLKGGDPFVFGRGGEELELLCQNRVPFEVVPGITSAISVPAYAGIPVTHRDFCSSIHIITGHQKENEPLKINFDLLSKTNGTLVFLMGVAALKQIADGLMEAGMDKATPAAVVQNGTRPNQRKLVATLSTIYDKAVAEQIKSPAIIIVGKVCELSEHYDWFSGRPLFGTRIIVTRPESSEWTLSKKLSDLGAEVFDFPCIKVEKIEDNRNLREAVSCLGKYQWLVFTSKNGVEIFFDYLKMNRLDVRVLGTANIAAIGSQTAAELEKYGILADYVPEVFDGTHLGQGLSDRMGQQDKALILRAKNGNEDLVRILSENRISCDDIPVYETVYIKDYQEQIMEQLTGKEPLYVTFTSASTVEGFVSCCNEEVLSKITGICIGEQTARAASNYNITHVVSKSATIDSMVEKITELNNDSK